MNLSAFSLLLLSLVSKHTSFAFRVMRRAIRMPVAVSSKSSSTKATKEGTQVRVVFRDREFFVTAGKKLRTELLQSQVSPHNGRAKEINCRGLGTCGTCAVEVVSGSVLPLELTAVEKLRLNFPPHSQHRNAERLRLTCQTAAAGDTLVLRKYTGFWGEKFEESAESADEFRLPLGDFEYLLDKEADKPSTPST
ncbi:hypothetical protein B484DRAFT_457439 [Ochromonadaceae sp. CCMP2298]|nr:hypothetical protein B484DRAFT_457439 [Ochromonadaceae sp. CCMP2298]